MLYRDSTLLRLLNKPITRVVGQFVANGVSQPFTGSCDVEMLKKTLDRTNGQQVMTIKSNMVESLSSP